MRLRLNPRTFYEKGHRLPSICESLHYTWITCELDNWDECKWELVGENMKKNKQKLTDHSSYSTTSRKHHFNTAMTLKDNPVVTNTSNKQFPVPVSSVKHLENHSFQSSHQPPQKMPQLV